MKAAHHAAARALMTAHTPKQKRRRKKRGAARATRNARGQFVRKPKLKKRGK